MGEILEVKYEGPEDPEQMKKIIDAVVKAYQDRVLMTERMAQAASDTDLEKVLVNIYKGIKEKLNEYERSATTLRNKANR